MGKQYWVIKTHKFKTMFNIQMSECKVKILLNNRWKIWHPTRIFFTSKVGTYLPTIHTALKNVMYFLSRAKSYCEKGFDRNTQSVGRAFYHRSHWFLWCLSSQQLCVLQAPNVSLLDYFLERHTSCIWKFLTCPLERAHIELLISKWRWICALKARDKFYFFSV